jgi:hypothetical protein
MKIYRLLVLVGGILLMVGAVLPWASGPSSSYYITTGLEISRSSGVGEGCMHTAGAGGILVLIALVHRGKPGKSYSRLATAISVLCGLLLAGAAFFITQVTLTDSPSFSLAFGLACVSPLGALLGLLGGMQRVSDSHEASRRALLRIAAFVYGAGAFYLIALLVFGFSFMHALIPPRTAVPSLNSTPTAKPSAAPGFTAIPMLTSTPVPALVAHEWSQSEPLITYARQRYSRGLAVDLPFEFTLLPSGDLYLLRSIENLQDEVILTTTLSRQATCRLLNSIDQAGFFDYDPSSYGRPPEEFVPSTTDISVHAWRANSVSLYGLNALNFPFESNWPNTKILPALRNTYWLLEHYQPPGNVHVLKPERLGVWLYGPPSPAGTDDFIWWPLKSYALATAGSTKRSLPSDPAMILTGEDATQVNDALGETLIKYSGSNFREGDKLYRVFARPLLPNEFNSSPLPQVSLNCSPSDGSIQKP